MTHALAVLGVVAAVHLAATAIPGPTSLVVVRAALARSPQAGIAAAAGIMVGDITWAAAAMVGLTAVLTRLGWLYTVLGVAGGAYLIYVGVLSWWEARRPAAFPPSGPERGRASMRRGLMTNLTNPKSMVFFGSIFAATLPAHASVALRLAALAVVACNALWWHVMLAVLLSRRSPRRMYHRVKPWIDRATGTVLIVFSVILIRDATSAL
jgi:threonine efflux protein